MPILLSRPLDRNTSEVLSIRSVAKLVSDTVKKEKINLCRDGVVFLVECASLCGALNPLVEGFSEYIKYWEVSGASSVGLVFYTYKDANGVEKSEKVKARKNLLLDVFDPSKRYVWATELNRSTRP